ncbi:MAG: UDP-N-acetylmuramoyl-L-alanyl-D-glutamate--2,6-diaminopimelate ligase [Bacteroidales bacterium]|jgi:UDP-N-acetylmuramoyl-L-alanyl-D-glutamate--2,6-diaminopimelate ligase|nr:UDP-N-acetylmuramoyl-L-alanyl-D-glutamate--2,6-diaminopimelate ligase [Bacteroidales bacterium]
MQQYKEIYEEIRSNKIEGICFDTSKVKPNYLFVAQKGTKTDGHNFISKAIDLGATYIVCQFIPSDISEETKSKVRFFIVENSQEALGFIASEFYDNPSTKLKVVGITGTNGKTTTVTLLHKLFMLLGFKTGLLSTIVNKINDKEISSTHTTPDAIELNDLLSQMVSNGCEFVFMEVSSHAIVQNRISGVSFSGGIFSNITPEHLDFHNTFQEYIRAKKLFFDNLSSNAFALTNIDDSNGEVMLQNTKAKKYTYSLKTIADFNAKIIESGFEGQLLEIDNIEFWTKLVGRYNAYNILAIYSTAILLGLTKQETLKAISELSSAEGRFDCVFTSKGNIAIIDYAHTPDALLNVIKTINQINDKGGKLISVVGCGGDRDKEKRPVMAKIAAENSDVLILTSDNPRTEDPQSILDDMKKGIDSVLDKKTHTIIDRKEAIKMACVLAMKNDIILIAGKGHEKYQEINGVKHPFDDKLEVLKY